jgi:hypothetical protein
VHDNFVILSNRTGNGRGHMVVGLYFDGATSNWKCHDNVIAEQSYGAWEGENDDLFREDDNYTVELRRRAAASEYIYLQYIKGQEAYNILCSHNIILNVRATEASKQLHEVYKDRLDALRNLREENTVFINGISRIPGGAQDIIDASGSYEQPGEGFLLPPNDY